MAIYYLHAQIIGRSAGRSAVAAAAYRSGERLFDERTGRTYDYSRRGGEIETEIMAPSGAPDWVQDRERLWNQVEAAERRVDAQVCREIVVAFPKELSTDQQRDLIRAYVQEQFVDRGMVADAAIHRNAGNPHAHIMLAMREIGPDGFSAKKNREWNKPENLERWREGWAEQSNRSLERIGREERIDYRSLAEQGAERLPQVHLGPHDAALERGGIMTDRGDHNRAVAEHNAVVVDLEKAKAERELLRQERERVQTGQWGKEEARAVAEAERLVGHPLNRAACEQQLKEYDGQRLALHGEIRRIQEEGERLERAQRALEDRDRALQGVSSLERPLERVKRWFSPEARQRYEQARERLGRENDWVERCGVQDRPDLAVQRQTWEQKNRRLPALEGGIKSLDPVVRILGGAARAFADVGWREFQRQAYERRKRERELDRERGMDWER